MNGLSDIKHKMIRSDVYKYDIFEQFALVGKSLGHANRLMILDVLSQGENDVDTLRQKVGLTIANVSKHLQVLKQAGLVKSRKEGLNHVYCMSDSSIFSLIVNLRGVAENHLEGLQNLLAEYGHDKTRYQTITLKNLEQMRRDNEKYTLVDVRPSDEYLAGHIPDAVNIPVDILSEKRLTLKQNELIILYCRGPYCMWSYEAIVLLKQLGYRAKILLAGYPEWELNSRQ